MQTCANIEFCCGEKLGESALKTIVPGRMCVLRWKCVSGFLCLFVAGIGGAS